MRFLATTAPFVLAVAISTFARGAEPASGRLPIIDMHLHALPVDVFGRVGVPNPVTGKPSSALTDDALARETLAALERYNVVRAATSGPSLELLESWRRAAPERIIPALGIGFGLPKPELAVLRELIRSRRVQLLGEVGAQYEGGTLSDPEYEPYLALAEELDVPVGIHTGMSGPGLTYQGSPKLRARLGDPMLIEEAVVRHPKLRVYVMHAGLPFLAETIALLHAHPQVYADVSAIDWVNGRAEFHAYLRALLDHADDCGLAKRILFGSDQMIWPEAIGMAIEGVESAPFLTQQQKRDIFCNNAARFLRLDEERVCGERQANGD